MHSISRSTADNTDTDIAVARDKIARSRSRSSDEIVGRLVDEHPSSGIAETKCAGHIGADKVALHDIAVGTKDVDTSCELIADASDRTVPRNKISGSRCCSAN